MTLVYTVSHPSLVSVLRHNQQLWSVNGRFSVVSGVCLFWRLYHGRIISNEKQRESWWRPVLIKTTSLWKLVVWLPGLHGYFHFDTMAAVALCHSVGSVSVLIQGIYQWLHPTKAIGYVSVPRQDLDGLQCTPVSLGFTWVGGM